ncbi:MAG: hypothetical protein WC634_01335 [archaeon]
MPLKLTVPNSFFHLIIALIIIALLTGAFAYVVLPGVVPNPGHALSTIQGYFQGDASLVQSLAKIQQQVTGLCAAGSSIRAINADGTVSCEADDVGAAGLGGSGTANYLAKWNAATALVNSVLYESGGNIGIGINAPKNKLDVEGGAVVGSAYSGTNTAPAEGLLVQGAVGIGTTSPSTGTVGPLKLDVEGPVGATAYCDQSGNNCKTIAQIAVLPTCADGDYLRFSGGAWVCSGTAPCTPNCGCAASTCTGSTCPNGCGGTCAGTKACCTPDCSCATGRCVGDTCSNGCGGNCAGTKVCTCLATVCVPQDVWGGCSSGTPVGGSCCLSGYPRCVPQDTWGGCSSGIKVGNSCCMYNCPTCVLQDIWGNCASGTKVGNSCCI